MLIVLTNSTYAQYPIVKKIGNDSVVIMTTTQGRKINELFEQNDKDIIRLKDSVDSLKTKYVYSIKVIDSLRVVRDTVRVKNDSLYKLYLDMKWRRDTNLVIYNKVERNYNKSIKTWQWINVGFIAFFIGLTMYNKIN